jgi:hypothetical protein
VSVGTSSLMLISPLPYVLVGLSEEALAADTHLPSESRARSSSTPENLST